MKLSESQISAINHIEGPSLVLAVPGAGKTTVLINRTHNLIKNKGVDAKKILSITFSKTSANDMKNRFYTMFKDESITCYFSTIHSFCFSVINDYGRKKKISFKMIEGNTDEYNKYTILKNIYLAINEKIITEDKLESLVSNIGYIKNLLITPEEFLRSNITEVENLIDIYYKYEEIKRRENLLDFDDMLTRTLEILESNLDILDHYRKMYDFIQVDEGQDTSKVQLEIIKLLAYPKNNLFIVADDDQSIYGFRGAYPKALLRFKDIYPDATLFYMEENFRSSKNIVDISNSFIKNNKMRYKKNIYTNNEFLKPIEIINSKTIEKQYDYILKNVKDKKLDNISILYRKNISSIGLIDLFEKNNIKFYIKENNNKFFNHWVIGDILNFIKFSNDIHNIDLYEKIYYKKKGYIGKKHIQYCKKLSTKLNVFRKILDYPGISYYYKNTLFQLEEDFRQLRKLSPSLAIDFIFYNLEYGEYLKEHAEKFGYSYESLTSIVYYLKLISREMKTTEDLVERLHLLKSLSMNSKDHEDAITLSTVHSSKGLEFNSVFIIDLIDGNFPSSSSIDKLESGSFDLIEEERRLFYVAMTRAKYDLHLITVDYLTSKRLEPSRFIQELRE